ncbi:hypothetical protein F3K20_20725 [Streptomyces scabiei]|nr:hypothetical protein [Streptomyces sp. LBUM 1484]MBP5868221.1 hypothetical protein [Streptomyces sp. LBUM 1485]MBP5884442.1 hypothetical protein [Streptomyces sp. LBUM 1487]MBP5900461.1 hypothetical protein [Streptomyces sp. LBUM 1488]MBP5915959.1 hypothetical protein [Streptomyces sp. LBUM 1486]QTU51044.1 hypothetical protein F3K20_20725 [Streptomyces sp. LBUM 1482]QTU59130.1 hypothetical protein F3K21_19725 [Streptomyces sp. LBUM 1480]QTU67196.1 hypothetical protein F3K22_19180 [Strepto
MYVDWVRAHDPAGEPVALDALAAVRARIPVAYEKPGRFLTGMEQWARRLPPAHLPWFWDMVGHRLTGWSARYAGKAFALARTAEREHGLPVDEEWYRANVLLLAGFGALPVTELTGHQRRLAAVLGADEAHAEYTRVLTAWAASPGELPATLAGRVRASAKAAGLGRDEDARVLAAVVGAAREKAVPDALLDALAVLLAEFPQDDEVYAALVDVFPDSRGDAASWLRVLLRSGAARAVVAGRVTPEGGVAGWLGRYARMYKHARVAGGGVTSQQAPPELFELVALFAPRLRAAGTPVRLHEDRYGHPELDADLLDACLAEGTAVEDPGDAIRLHFWGGRSRSDLSALAADPVFGPRLEGTVHAGLRGGGTAITRLPENAAIAAEVRTRIEKLIDELRHGGIAAADEAVDELTGLLDRPTATALDGVEEALATLDLTGPLSRALTAGLPEELGWPALEKALTELAADPTADEAGSAAGSGGVGSTGTNGDGAADRNGFAGKTVRNGHGEAADRNGRAEEAGRNRRTDHLVRGVTATWPVLTVYGDDRAVAVDHTGRRGACAFTLPEGTTSHSVHYAGGRFLVSWTAEKRAGFGSHACWADRPEEVFEPEQRLGLRPYAGLIDGGFGFQFASPDGGRHDGDRVLRPGDRSGIGSRELQMSDGERVWSADVFRGDWQRVDPSTGARTGDPELPGFHREVEVPPGRAVFADALTLAALPEDAPPSPLGQDGRLTGCHVQYRTPYAGPSPTDFLLRTVDGREGRFVSTRPGLHPWGILRAPGGGEDAVLVEPRHVRVHATADGSLLWESHGFPATERHRGRTPSPHSVGPLPPPAYWHFLTPRDDASSKALRAVRDTEARALLGAATLGTPGAPTGAAEGTGAAEAAVRAVLGRLLPEVTEPRIVDGVVRVTLLAADALRRRATLSRRVRIMRSGPVVTLPAEIPDTALSPALHGLLPELRAHDAPVPGPRPATLTSIAADGRYLRGEIDDETRRLALPAEPLDWPALLGRIDAVAWRTAVETTSAEERTSLAALLRTWSGQPFAERGGSWRTGRAPLPALSASRSAGDPITSAGERGGTARFVQRAAAPAPSPGPADPVASSLTEGGDGHATVTVERDDTARLSELLDLVERRGPLPLPARAVEVFSRRTGARGPIALLVLAGLPRRKGSDDDTKLLRSKPYGANRQVIEEYRALWHRLGPAGRRAVLAAGVPDTPADLWEDGGTVAAAERMAEAWTALLGATPYVDDALADAVETDLGLPATWAHSLTTGQVPADRTAFGAPGFVLAGSTGGGLQLHRAEPDGTAGARVGGYALPDRELLAVVAWALTECPVGDLSAGPAVRLFGRLRALLDTPGTLVHLGRHPSLAATAPGTPGFAPHTGPVLPCPQPLRANATAPTAVYDDGLLVVSAPHGDVFLHTSALAGPAATAALERTERLCGDLALSRLLGEVHALQELRTGGLARMTERVSTTPVPPGGYELNPALSVPGLVTEAAGTLGVGPEAATLYLQLLTLARPTDQNIRRWNDWTPARHRAAETELLTTGAAERAKRPRAGRTLFVPGPWTDLKSPHLPLETAKLPHHRAEALTPTDLRGPFPRLLCPVPPHELFTRTWTTAR